MEFKFLYLVWLISAACSRPDNTDQQTTVTTSDSLKLEAQNLYTAHCAGCHGTDLSGTSATALIKDNWTYGRTRDLMFRNVKFGINQTDMAGFQHLLSDDQIGAVVDYIREVQDKPADRKVEIPDNLKFEDYLVKVEQVATGLEVPWAIEFVDQEQALISERKGQLRWLVGNKLDPVPIEGTPIPYTGTNTGGYMDIALDPNYQENGWVYLAYSHSRQNYEDESEPATTRVIRGRIADHRWTDEQNLFLAADSLWVTNGNRWGCRLLFDDKGHLYFSVGDMARAMDSQDPGQVSGKIYRINADGTYPEDNPYMDSSGALKSVFSLGNRNVQGFAIHPGTRDIWFSEHGPMGGDELNILKKGVNYGWPIITYGRDYSGEVVSGQTHQEGMEQPIHQWTPSIGICPVEFIESGQFPAWHHNLLVGALAFEELQRLVIENDVIVHSEMLLKGLGRVRDIKTAPDGSIFVVLNSPDILLKLSVMGQMPANR